MSFFDEAVEQFIANNPGLPKTFQQSDFLLQLRHQVELAMENCKGRIWTPQLSEQIKVQISYFIIEYEKKNPLFKYKNDSKLFYKTKEMYVDYKELPSDPTQTIMITIAT